MKEAWLPVCGAHWSAMPMSHEACQTLGYSRANETLFVYGSAGAGGGARVHSHELGGRGAQSGMHSNVSRPELIKPRRTRLAAAAAGEILSSSESQSERKRRSPGGWFDVSPGDIFATAPAAADAADAGDDNGEQFASIIENIASSESSTKTLGSAQRADHLIRYELHSWAAAAPPTSDITQTELAAIDSAEIKFRSLFYLLFRGPELGCAGRPSHLVSSVHLQCENFQCGRSVSSYSSRVRLQQRLAKKSIPSEQSANEITEELVEDESSLLALARSPASGRQMMEKPTDTQTGGPSERVQRLEATEELDYEHYSISEEDDDDYKQDGSEIRPLDEDEKNGSEQRRSTISSRLVVGGMESMPGEFPYLAALHGGPDEVFFCGGVLISINWLLTAAHCVGNRTQPDGWMVKVGVTRRIASPAFVKKLKVRKIIKHPNFNQDSMFNNDIALIQLEESVEYNQFLRPICLPRANLKLGPDNSKDCVVVGFGKSKFSQEANYLHVAHFVNVPIVHHTVCSGWYAEHGVNLTEGMLCAGYAEGKRDACQVSAFCSPMRRLEHDHRSEINQSRIFSLFARGLIF